MALSDYEHYQLEWMIEHGHGLTELVEDMSELSYDMPNAEVGTLFDVWEADHGFDGEIYASEAEWREADRGGHDPFQQTVRDWYVSTFPTDELGPDIKAGLTFKDALDAVSLGSGFYDAMGVGDSIARERIFAELGKRFGIDYDAIFDAWLNKSPVERPANTEEERASFKDRLVVLDTRPGWDGQTDALVYDPGAPKDLTPFIIATGFDAESRSWRSGSYRNDLMGALCEFRRTINPEWAISGCTPDDVTELYGDYCHFEPEDASEVAHTVNEWMSNYDDLYSDEIDACIGEWLSDGKLVTANARKNTPKAFADCAAQHGATFVSVEDIKALIEEHDDPEAHKTYGMFAAVEPSGGFTVCDNTNGECWVESFETVAGAEAFMRSADAERAYEIDRKAVSRSVSCDPAAVAQSACEVARSADPVAEAVRRSVHQ